MIDDLIDGGMVSALNIATEDFQPVIAYQVTAKALSFVKILPGSVKEAVEKFTKPPKVSSTTAVPLHVLYAAHFPVRANIHRTTATFLWNPPVEYTAPSKA